MCIKWQQSFITISKIQDMHFRSPNNLYEFPVFYKSFLYDGRFNHKNIKKICKKSLYKNNNGWRIKLCCWRSTLSNFFLFASKVMKNNEKRSLWLKNFYEIRIVGRIYHRREQRSKKSFDGSNTVWKNL